MMLERFLDECAEYATQNPSRNLEVFTETLWPPGAAWAFSAASAIDLQRVIADGQGGMKLPAKYFKAFSRKGIHRGK